MKKLLCVLIVLLFTLSLYGIEWQSDGDLIKILRTLDRDNKAEGFLFGNHIDSHQKSFIINEEEEIIGFLYVTFTGETDENGIPIAVHCNEETPGEDCIPAWLIKGKKGEATFVYHYEEHPLWLTGRNAIPQPGAYSHFHWLGNPDKAMDLIYGDIYKGYFLELKAIRKFVFRSHNQDILIKPGTDSASHVNIVSTFPGF